MATIEADPGVGLNGALARTLNGERAAKRLTIDALAVKSGISKRTLIRYLMGERLIPVAVLEEVARVYRVKPSTLLRAAEARLTEED